MDFMKYLCFANETMKKFKAVFLIAIKVFFLYKYNILP